MRAMVCPGAGHPLELRDLPLPQPGPGQVLVRVRACGVCRTDLHILDGDLTPPRLPLVPGHEVVGTIVQGGEGTRQASEGQRVGIPWLGWTDGSCRFCRSDQENLCERARFTGFSLDGGYAEYVVADERFCFPLPDAYSDVAAAPLLCAGLIGFRTLRLAGQDRKHVGIFGFGAAAHIVAQVALQQGRSVYGFTRPGDAQGQAFARGLGVPWAGGSDEQPPVQLDAALIFAPVGDLVVAALRAVRPGGTVVCGGIHMSDIPSFPYRLLWEERSIRSVANLTRSDGRDLLTWAAEHPLETHTTEFALEDANVALEALRRGRLKGAAVLRLG